MTSEDKRSNMCIKQGQLSKYFMIRALLTGRMTYDVSVSVGGCLCVLVNS